jgi:hypothetical protein
MRRRTASPLHQPDGMITQVRQACGAGRVRVNGVCVAEPPSARPAEPTAGVRDGVVAFALGGTETPPNRATSAAITVAAQVAASNHECAPLPPTRGREIVPKTPHPCWRKSSRRSSAAAAVKSQRKEGACSSRAPLSILSGQGGRECPLWVMSRHRVTFASCPFFPSKRTFIGASAGH